MNEDQIHTAQDTNSGGHTLVKNGMNLLVS